MSDNNKTLSVVIPAYNEEGSIEGTINAFHSVLRENKVQHEIIVINDNSTDTTLTILKKVEKTIPEVIIYTNPGPNGFGYAVRLGLERFSGDFVAIVMADLSDSPHDLLSFYKEMKESNLDCVFGSRFIKGGVAINYPHYKLIINRIANKVIQLFMWIDYNDTTNAFKLYKRETIEGLKPFISQHFNLTIELPLKAIIRGYNYKVIPNSWQNRNFGESKLHIREMGSRYFYILVYCLIEKYFRKGDFKKENQ